MSREALFPARAGMNRSGLTGSVPNRTVPRTRGDEPAIDTILPTTKTCSPHARG